jgi:hypothetical protein
MPVKLNSTGGGSVTLTTPSTATDYTATFPANTGNVVTTGSSAVVTPAMLSTGAPSWDSSGVLSFNSGYGSVATAYGCRAWVNFNGSGTIAIRASGNVSSITDNGVGTYQVNFTTAMPDANYSVISFPRANVGTDATLMFLDGTPVAGNTGNIGVQQRASGAAFDPTVVCIAVFR